MSCPHAHTSLFEMIQFVSRCSRHMMVPIIYCPESYKLDLNGRQDTVSVDRLKPAHLDVALTDLFTSCIIANTNLHTYTINTTHPNTAY